jgi:hypothetical protein
MNTLWTFGDSFTESYVVSGENAKTNFRYHYHKWKGYVPKVYGEILSEKLGFDLKNYGVGGWCNNSIFESFCKVANQIKKDDLVIIGWTGYERFRMVVQNEYWKSYIPNCVGEDSGDKSISVRTLEEILINRSNKNYIVEVDNWINLINHSMKNNVIHWTPFPNDSKKITTLKGFEVISDETKGVINDGHLSEKGQLELAQSLETIYKNNLKKGLI